MVNLEKDDSIKEKTKSAYIGEDIPNDPADYREEIAAEIAAPVLIRRRGYDDLRGRTEGGTSTGYVALALSILSLFVWPLLLGAVGIVLGIFARRGGAEGLGAWAIGIGAVSIIVGIFILPFF